MVNRQQLRSPSYGALALNPVAGGKSGLPIIPGLLQKLAAGYGGTDFDVARAMAILAGYSYSDLPTVAEMATRIGMPSSRCVAVSEFVDAMFIDSSAFVIQSADRDVVIVSYRGTQPTSLINWLTDVTLEPTKIEVPVGGRVSKGRPGDLWVHGGFYRNVRATRYAVGQELWKAADGQAIINDEEDAEGSGTDGLKAIYLTGHSLGAAMAVIMAILIETDPAYTEIRPFLKGVYTFGQPMIGSRALSEACRQDGIASRVHRFIYRNDVVPHLPPIESAFPGPGGGYSHFGDGHRFKCGWRDTSGPSPMWALGLTSIPFDAAARLVPLLSTSCLPYSIVDHGPQNYIQALTNPGAATEFGDVTLGTPARR